MEKEAKTNLKIILSMMILLVMMVGLVKAWYITFNFPVAGENMTGAPANRMLNVTVTSGNGSEMLNLSNITFFYNISGGASWTIIGSNLTPDLNQTTDLGQTLNFTFTWAIPALNGTSYYINATAYNVSGQSNSTVVMVNIDTIDPIITLNLPINYSNTSNTQVTFNYTPTDLNIDECRMYVNVSTAGSALELNTTNATPASGSFHSFTLTFSNDGNYTWNVWCNDTFGNTNRTDNYTFTIDRTLPALVPDTPFIDAGKSSPPEFYNYTNYPVTLRVNATDSGNRNSLRSVWFILNSGALGAGTNISTYTGLSTISSETGAAYAINITTNFTSPYTGPGAHSLFFCANDSAGNQNCSLPLNIIIKGVNVTQIENLIPYFTLNFTYQNGTDVDANAFLSPTLFNYTMILNRTNPAGQKVIIEVVGFAINETLVGQTNSTNMSTDIHSNFKNAMGGNGYSQTLSWFDGSAMFPQEAFYSYGKVTLPTTAYDSYYYCNGTYSSPTCFSLSRCTNTSAINYTNHSAIPVSSGCYLNSGPNLVLYIDHFTGGGGGYDNVSPTITINYPAASQYLSDNTPLINITIVDEGVGLNNVSGFNISINGTWYSYPDNITACTTSNGTAAFAMNYTRNVTCWFNTSTLVDGTVELNATGRDFNGNQQNTTRNFVVDTGDPTMLLAINTTQNLANVVNLTSGNFNISVLSTDPSIDECRLYANFSGTYAVNMTNTTPIPNNVSKFNVSGVADGIYVWSVWCNDSSGRETWNGTNYTIRVDTTAPAITLNRPFANNTYNTSGTLVLNWTITDLTPLLEYVSYSIDDSVSESLNYFHNFTRTSPGRDVYSAFRIYEVPDTAASPDYISAIPSSGVLAEGPHKISIIAQDWLGNDYTLIYNYTVDRDVPSVKNNTFAANATPIVSQGETIYINMTWNESNPQTIKIFRNGTLLGPPGVITLANLSESHRGIGDSNETIFGTSEARIFNISFPTDTSFTIIVNISTNSSWYGIYNFTVELTDRVGYATNVTGSIVDSNKYLIVNVTDNNAPVINITYPKDPTGNYTHYNGTVNGNLTITFSLEDLGTLNLSTLSIKINSTVGAQKFNWTPINFSYTGDCGLTTNLVTTAVCSVTFNVTKNVTRDGLNDGNYTLNITVTDVAGNRNTNSTWFYVDTVAPNLAPIITLSHNGTGSNRTGHIWATWSGQNDAVANTTIFEIWRNNSASGSTLSAAGFAFLANYSASPFEDNGTIHNVEYYYKIKYYDRAGNSNWSEVVNLTASDTSIPKMPTGLTASCSGATATLGWTHVTQDNQSANDSVSMRYKIYYQTNSSTYPINTNATILYINQSNTTNWNIQATNLSDGVNTTTVSVTTAGTNKWIFMMSSIDDGGNENSTLIANTNSANCSLIYTATTTTTSSSGGGGGGGGIAAAAATNVQASASHAWTSVSAGESVSMAISNVDIGVTEVAVTVKNAVTSVSVKVASLKEKPATVTQAAAKVYKYLEVTPKNIAEGDIDKATIKFQVTKSWLTEQGLAQNDVVLYRHADNKWNKLTTKVVSSDADKVYYEADTPGFSYFAIGTGAAAPAAAEEEAAAEAAAEEAEEVTPPAAKPPVTPPAASKAWIGLLIAAIVVIGIIVYIVTKKKK